MAVSIITKLTDLLKLIGIDSSKYLGKVDPNVKQFVPLTGTTARKPGLIRALSKDGETFKPSDVKEVFEKDAQYLGQMNEMEMQNFYNNVQDYVKAGGKRENIPSNVVTQEGKPLEGKKLEKLSERKGAPGKFDESLQGGLQSIMKLVDEIQGISPRDRNTKNRRELAEFIYKMRGKDFTNEQIKMIRAYMDDDYSMGFAKDKASAMLIGKKMGAKDIDEFELVDEYVDNVNSYSPKDFKETYGNVKHVNMEISSLIDKKLQRHFKKKYKWDDTKKDGGLDDKTYEMYDDDFFEASKKFGDFHTMFDSGPANMFGMRKGKSWVNHPNNYLAEASEEMERITGKGLNVEFLKKFTDDALTKYPEPEKFQYGGPVIKGPDLGDTAHGSAELASRQRILQPGGQMTTSTGLNYLLGEDDNNRIPFNSGMLVPPKKPSFDGLFNTEVGGPVIGPKDDSMFEAVVDRWSQFARQQGAEPEDAEKNKMFALENIYRLGREQGYEDDEIKLIIQRVNKADGGRIGYRGGYLVGGLKKLGRKYKNSTLEAILENPKLVGTELGYEGLAEILKLIGMKDGGRIRFSEGGMSRRNFLKLLGGLAAVPVVGKFFKFAKAGKGVTKVPVIKTAPVEGKPEWFDALVNKVISEGDNVSKKFATGERQSIHQKTLDDGSVVRVTEDVDDGAVRVEYESEANVYGDPVQLEYKKPLPDEKTPNPAAEFTTAESGPVGRSIGPDDYEIELDEVGGMSIRDLDSDVSKLKEYATGQKPTMKEIVQNMKRKDKASAISEGGQAESDAVIRRQGDYVQFEDIDPEVDYATGGRVGFMAGGIGKAFKLAKRFRESKAYKKFIEKLFLKTSTDIRRGEGIFKNISVDEKIKMHDDLTKAVVDYQKTGELPESTHQYFGFNPEIQYAETLMQKQLKMTPEQELRQEFPGISDKMVGNILADTNQQRIAEVKATMKEALKMQEKGMGVDEIIQVIEKTPRTKNASGGLAGMLGE